MFDIILNGDLDLMLPWGLMQSLVASRRTPFTSIPINIEKNGIEKIVIFQKNINPLSRLAGRRLYGEAIKKRKQK